MSDNSINVEEVRNQTQAVKKLIHFNNAGASLMPDVVIKGIMSFIHAEVKNGGYETAEMFTKELDSFYQNAATLINATSDEIAFTESATVAWQRAIHSVPFTKGDIILTCVSEYASNYIAYLQLVKLQGIEIKVIPNDPTGAMDISALEKAITSNVKLISICHIPTGNGLINPVVEAGVVAARNNILYLLDACQSVGQYPVDVKKIKCDFLSVTGRKYLRGPRGTGFLYARKNTTQNLEPIALDLHGAEWITSDTYRMRTDAKKYETWESSLSSKYGLSLAINYLNQLSITAVYRRIVSLASYFREELRSIGHIQVLDTGVNQSGIVTFISEKCTPSEIKKYLSLNNINVSVVVASSSLLDLSERKIKEAVRASVHYYNTKEEVNQVIELLKKL